MPRKFKKRSYRRKRKRFNPAKARKGSSVAVWQNRFSGFPDKFYVKLKYATVLALAPATGVYAEAVYRMNSVYDPQFAAGGDQPTYFDNLAGMYLNYTVVRSNIRVSQLPTAPAGGSDASSGSIVIYPSNSSSGVASYLSAIQLDGSKHMTLGFYAGQEKSNMIGQSRSIASMAGRSASAIYTESSFSSVVTDNPISESFWIVGVINSSTATMDCEVLIQIDYYVCFQGLAPLELS